MNHTPREVDTYDVVHQFHDARNAASQPAAHPTLQVEAIMRFAGTASVSEFARLAGVSRRTIYRWMRSGLNPFIADKLSIGVAHVHPACIFGAAWFHAAEEAAAA